jgi:hypothetical protein
MGQYVESAASGQGSALIDSGAVWPVLEVAYTIVTPATNARLYGISPVQRVFQQGTFGLGLTAGGGPFTGLFLVSWWGHFEIYTATITPQPFGQPPADTLWWDIQPGGVMMIEVDW